MDFDKISSHSNGISYKLKEGNAIGIIDNNPLGSVDFDNNPLSC